MSMTGNNSNTNPDADTEPEPYIAPRTTPHPDETPISPYDTRELGELPFTNHRRTLLMVAQSIRSTEAQLKSQLSKLGKSTQGDMRNETINTNQIMIQKPHLLADARRAQTAQQNLRTHYRKWANLCEQHFREVQHNETDGE